MISSKYYKHFMKGANITGRTEEEKNWDKKLIDYSDTNKEDNERIHKDKDKLVTM